jgi:hypothetical protein
MTKLVIANRCFAKFAYRGHQLMSSGKICIRSTLTDPFLLLSCSNSTVAIKWAQRKDRIILIVDVPDIDASSLQVEILEQKIIITAKSLSKDVNVELNLYGKVKAEVRCKVLIF